MAGTHGDSKEHANHHPVHVEEWDGHQYGFFPGIQGGHPIIDLEGIGNQIPVHGHRCLGDTSGAAAVLEQGDVIRSDIQLGAIFGFVLGKQILQPECHLVPIPHGSRLSSPWPV